VVIDPALPLGLISPSLELPYAVVLHGADHRPVASRLEAAPSATLRRAEHLIAAGGYPAAEANARPVGRCRPPWCHPASTPRSTTRR
jgi:phosphatidylinositol alpha-1,6-mannosyltransferase